MKFAAGVLTLLLVTPVAPRPPAAAPPPPAPTILPPGQEWLGEPFLPAAFRDATAVAEPAADPGIVPSPGTGRRSHDLPVQDRVALVLASSGGLRPGPLPRSPVRRPGPGVLGCRLHGGIPARAASRSPAVPDERVPGQLRHAPDVDRPDLSDGRRAGRGGIHSAAPRRGGAPLLEGHRSEAEAGRRRPRPLPPRERPGCSSRDSLGERESRPQ